MLPTLVGRRRQAPPPVSSQRGISRRLLIYLVVSMVLSAVLLRTLITSPESGVSSSPAGSEKHAQQQQQDGLESGTDAFLARRAPEKLLGVAIVVDLLPLSLAMAAAHCETTRSFGDGLAKRMQYARATVVALVPWNTPHSVLKWLIDVAGYDEVEIMHPPVPFRTMRSQFLQVALLADSSVNDIFWLHALTMTEFTTMVIFPVSVVLEDSGEPLSTLLHSHIFNQEEWWRTRQDHHTPPSAFTTLLPHMDVPGSTSTQLKQEKPAVHQNVMKQWEAWGDAPSLSIVVLFPSLTSHSEAVEWMLSDDVSKGLTGATSTDFWSSRAVSVSLLRLCLSEIFATEVVEDLNLLKECQGITGWCNSDGDMLFRQLNADTWEAPSAHMDSIKLLLSDNDGNIKMKSQKKKKKLEYQEPIWRNLTGTEPHVLTPQQHKNMAHFWRLVPGHNLILVNIPKNASTQLIQLFLRMIGSPLWNTTVLHKVHFNSEAFSNEVLLSQMSLEKAQELLNDRTITKAVLFRDPVDRLVSCFLDKFVQRGIGYSTRIMGTLDGKSLSFEDMVSALLASDKETAIALGVTNQWGLSGATNPHWREQWRFVGEGLLDQINFIGRQEFASTHMEILLEKLGLWEEYGASGWGPLGTSAIFEKATVSDHSTSKGDVHALYLSEPDDSIVARIEHAYAADYELPLLSRKEVT